MQYETISAIIIHIIDAVSPRPAVHNRIYINDPYEYALSEEWFITDPQSTNNVLRWPLYRFTGNSSDVNNNRVAVVIIKLQ